MFGSIKSFFKKKCPTVGEASIKSELIDYHSRCGVGRSELLNDEALKLHKIGYNMGNISIALFNNPGFLATKTNKAGSRYLKLTKRLVDILPKREYTD